MDGIPIELTIDTPLFSDRELGFSVTTTLTSLINFNVLLLQF